MYFLFNAHKRIQYACACLNSKWKLLLSEKPSRPMPSHLNRVNSSASNSTGSEPKSTQKQQNGETQSKESKKPHQQNGNLSNSTSTSINGDTVTKTEELKIIGHLKSIEKINETRRIFLSNTISETDIDIGSLSGSEATSATASKTSITKTAKATATETTTSQIINGETAQNETVRSYSEECSTQKMDDQIPNSMNAGIDKQPTPTTLLFPTTTVKSLKSPTTPPPKPPMLSRTRSFRSNDPSSTTPTTPVTPIVQSPNTNTSVGFTSEPPQAIPTTGPIMATSSTTNTTNPITTVAVTTKIIPEPIKASAVQVQVQQPPEETPILRRKTDNQMAIKTDGPKQISINHYERLIEELKCPGCASPMKPPILLCKTGHSICEQCTRVLLLCPLCKEPFTNIRSLTVEALCSKAHFRCANASGGCTVRLHLDLLGWHEKQCIYKPMKCFMGRVWGDCQWSGREAFWKDHLEEEHANKVFKNETVDLIWNMGVKQKPLTGYYVFEVFNEMFNFYEVFDKERVLFTMTCTSTVKEKKHNFAFEVTMIHKDNDALAITQKFPVHSEYDADILMDGTCVSIQLSELAKFIDEDRLLHYRVRVLEVNSPRKLKSLRHSCPPSGIHPIDFQQTQIEGVNLKNVPDDIIVTRKLDDLSLVGTTPSATPTITNGSTGAASSSEDEIEKIRERYSRKLALARQSKNDDSDSDTDPEFEAFIAKKWGTPQMHFNRKYLKTNSDASSTEDRNGDFFGKSDKKFQNDDRISIASTTTSYRKKMTNTLRRSFRSIQKPIMEMKPFGKKSPEKKADVEVETN